MAIGSELDCVAFDEHVAWVEFSMDVVGLGQVTQPLHNLGKVIDLLIQTDTDFILNNAPETTITLFHENVNSV